MDDALTLVSHWHIPAPVESVWERPRRPRHWPRWWRYVREATELFPGDRHGMSAVHRLVWDTRLPYRIVLVTRVTRLDPLRIIEAEAAGDLSGTGRWRLWAVGDATLVRYEWSVHLGKRWLRWLAPGLRPVYVWNHQAVMNAGEAGLIAYLAGAAAERSG